MCRVDSRRQAGLTAHSLFLFVAQALGQNMSICVYRYIHTQKCIFGDKHVLPMHLQIIRIFAWLQSDTGTVNFLRNFKCAGSVESLRVSSLCLLANRYSLFHAIPMMAHTKPIPLKPNRRTPYWTAGPINQRCAQNMSHPWIGNPIKWKANHELQIIAAMPSA